MIEAKNVSISIRFAEIAKFSVAFWELSYDL